MADHHNDGEPLHARDFQSDEEDEQYARDLQLAMEMEYAEHQRLVAAASALLPPREVGQDHGHASADTQSLRDTPSHMLFVICEIEGRAVEMLIDSGASNSVISLRLVQQLGLMHRLNKNVTGNASGVGAAKIVGVLENCICTVGDNVEFRILFLVLQSNDPWIILGLDQMQRFKCIIDLERHVMLFGGREGVEVPFLDQELAGEAARKKTTASTDPLPAMDDTESATMVLPAAPATASRPPTTSGSGNTTPTKRWGFRNLMRKPSS